MKKNIPYLKIALFISVALNIFVASMAITRFARDHDDHPFFSEKHETKNQKQAFRKVWKENRKALRPHFLKFMHARNKLHQNLEGKSQEAEFRAAFAEYQKENQQAIADLSDLLIDIAMDLPEQQRAQFLMKWGQKRHIKKPKSSR